MTTRGSGWDGAVRDWERDLGEVLADRALEDRPQADSRPLVVGDRQLAPQVLVRLVRLGLEIEL
jgi:hypothetical protein